MPFLLKSWGEILNFSSPDESDSFSIASNDSRYQITSLPSSSSVTSKTQRDGDRVSLSSRPGSRMFQYLTTGADDALPALSTSLFSNVPPTINFVGVDEKGKDCWLV